MTKRMPINGTEYVIDELDWGERNAILDEATEMTERGLMKTRTGTLRTFTVLLGVKSPKLELKTHTRHGIIVRNIYNGKKKLSDETLEKLYNEIAGLAPPLAPSPEPSSSTKALNARPPSKPTE